MWGYRQLLMTIIMVLFLSCYVASGFSENEYSAYPGDFDGRGIIHRIDETSVVINDTSFKLTSKTRFNRPSLLNCSKKSFQKGKYVVYLLDSKNKGNIKSLWLLNKRNDYQGRP